MKYYITADVHGFYTEFHKALDESGISLIHSRTS